MGYSNATVNLLYLGNFASTDIKEYNYDAENTDFLIGTNVDYTTLQVVSTEVFSGRDNVVADDDYGRGEDIKYDLGDGAVRPTTDASFKGYVTVTDPDGNEQSIEVAFVQADNGDLFITDLGNAGTLDNLEISSVTIDEITETKFIGWTDSYSVDNTSIVEPNDPSDGAVDGEETGEVMGIGYDDADGATDGGGDIIDGDDGLNDTIFGNGGDDTIDAGKGDDLVEGGEGDDVIDGNVGDDTIYGDNSATTGELLINGALESGVADNTFVQTSSITGWNSNTGLIESWGDGFENENSTDGGNFVELDAERGVDSIYQDVATVEDATYTYSFEAMQRVEGSDDQLEVYFGGELIATIQPEDEWQTYTFEVTGSGDDRVEIKELSSQDTTFGPLIDNVSLVGELPEASGDDTIKGNDGDDLIFGQGGDDSLDGGENDDTIYGGEGDDTIDGDDDDDLLSGGEGDDYISGGASEDTIDGGSGDDTISGDKGDDFITGGTGDDSLEGGNADDTIYGGSEPTQGSGVTGELLINGALESGVADNTFVQTASIEGWNPSADLIETWGDGFANENSSDGGNFVELDAERGIDGIFQDVETVEDATYTYSFDAMQRVEGSDDELEVYFGGELIATIQPGDEWKTYTFEVTGSGDDRVEIKEVSSDNNTFGPLIDNVSLVGELPTESGNDTIYGGEGEDSLFGQSGDDSITGGSSADTIDGGAGADTIVVGGPGDGIGDVVDGGSAGDDNDVLDLTGSSEDGGSLSVTITGEDSNGNGFDGYVTYYDSDGDVSGTLQFEEIEEIIPCFTPGTLIATPNGEVCVEALKAGDQIITRDNGIQTLRWVGSRTMTKEELLDQGRLRPILIRKGALGQNQPSRDMMVSPNHRVLVSSGQVELLFEENEVLVAAKHLTGLDGVERVKADQVTYIHIMFDHHEVVLSDSAWTESFQPGDMSLKGVGQAQRDEIFALFPELATHDGIQSYASARRVLRKHEAALL